MFWRFTYPLLAAALFLVVLLDDVVPITGMSALLPEDADKETGAMLAEASGNQALAAGIEVRMGEAEASAAQGHSLVNGDLEAARSGALTVANARRQIAAAQVRAAIYEQSAAKAAAAAETELKEIEEIPAQAAKLAAEEAKRLVRAELSKAASSVAVVKSRLTDPGLPAPLAEAAAQAAQPYYDVMQKSIAMADLYQQSARSLESQARALQDQSRKVASQAVLYQTAGNGDMGAKLMAQAKGMLNEAQAKEAQAKKEFAVADDALKQVPNYQANAALASAYATSIANQGGQLPPANAPKFLL